MYKNGINSTLLLHHGVKGQKWGVRRSRSFLRASRKKASPVANKVGVSLLKATKAFGRGSAKVAGYSGRKAVEHYKTSKAKKKAKAEEARKHMSDYHLAKMLKKKNRKHLSNDELRFLSDRASLENKYRDARKKGSKVTRGVGFVKGVTAVVTTAGAFYALKNNPLVKDVAKNVFTGAVASKAATKKAPIGSMTPLSANRMTNFVGITTPPFR